VVHKINSWPAIFAFPVFFTTFEWLLIRFSPDGTAASIAYSQSDFLAIIQVASVTGILGITFIVTFIPSALALGWHFRRNKKQLLSLVSVSTLLVATVFIFGAIRMNSEPSGNSITVGLAVLEEQSHKMGSNLDFDDELLHTARYANEVARLATRGAKVVVLPERAININAEIALATDSILTKAARESKVMVVAGYTNFKHKDKRNSAMVTNSEGQIVLDYNKAHLVTGLEDQFVPGSDIGLSSFQGIQTGVAVCKDMDFSNFTRKYGLGQVVFLCVPAWDFVVDDWLHSRMAVLAGVENGFSEVRPARLGRLTISDQYGRITAETSCVDKKTTSLIGQVSTDRIQTFYTQYGDWFGILVACAALLFFFLMLARGKANH
jgi:apolipoprotein N-acyltransferase